MMKTNSKLTAILSYILTAVLAIASVVCFFVLGLNVPQSKAQSVTVSYGSYVLLNDEAEKEILDHIRGEFPGAIVQNSSATSNGEITISGNNLEAKAGSLESYLRSTYPDGEFYVAVHSANVQGSLSYLLRAALIAGAIVVVAFVYTAIRYRLYAGFTNLIGGVSTVALTFGVAILTRTMGGEYAATLAIAALALYEVLTLALFGNAKSIFPAMKENSADEAVVSAVKATKKTILVTLIFAVVLSLVLVWSGILPVALTIATIAITAFTSVVMTPATFALLKAPVDAKDKAKEAYDYKE